MNGVITPFTLILNRVATRSWMEPALQANETATASPRCAPRQTNRPRFQDSAEP